MKRLLTSLLLTLLVLGALAAPALRAHASAARDLGVYAGEIGDVDTKKGKRS